MSVDRFSALEERVSEYQAALLERGDTLSFNTQLLLGELRAALRGVPPAPTPFADPAVQALAADAVRLAGMVDALREAAQALLDECADGDFHYARSPTNGALDRLRAALQGSPKEHQP